jgi:hypothetical protein
MSSRSASRIWPAAVGSDVSGVQMLADGVLDLREVSVSKQ